MLARSRAVQSMMRGPDPGLIGRPWRLAALLLGVALSLALVRGVDATQNSAGTVLVEVRVWQDVTDSAAIYVSARAAGGSWRASALLPLLLDDGISPSGAFRYGDIRLDVPLRRHASGALVELRVWQRVEDGGELHVSARAADGSWRTLGTVPLIPYGLSGDGRLRFGDFTLEVPVPSGEVSTLAKGFGRPTSSPSGWYGFGLTVDRDGSVIVADRKNHVIRRVTPDGAVTTIAGSWQWPGLRDGPAETARFNDPQDVAVAPNGAIYVADGGNHRVRKITPEGMVITVAGSDRAGAEYHEIRDGPAGQALFHSGGPTALALDWYGDLYILERYAVRRLSPSGWVSTVVGGNDAGWRDGPADQALVFGLQDIAVDDAGNLYVIDDDRQISSDVPALAIRKIGVDGIVETLYLDESPSLGGTLAYPSGIAVSGSGAVYLSNTGRDQIVTLTEEGELRTVAGTGEEGHLDGARGTAMFSAPGRLAFAPDGALVVADQSGTVIRRVAVGGEGADSADVPLARAADLPRVPGVSVSVFAGSGKQGFVDGPAEEARFLFPWAMTLDGSGNIIVADRGNHAIRSVSADGTVTTLAGGNGAGTRDGPCQDAQFSEPSGVVADPERGTLYVSDWSGHRIRRIAREGASCVVTTIAGGEQGVADGPAATARFSWPEGLALDGEGGLLIADKGFSLIRRLSPEGRVETIASGGPSAALWSDHGSRDGPVELARFSLSGGLAVDDEGNIFFPESNNAIRKIDRTGFVSTVLRTADYSRGGALSPFTSGIVIGRGGELYVADYGFGRVVRVGPDGALAIVADGEHAPPLPLVGRDLDPGGLLMAPSGDLFVTSRHGSVIFRITFEETAAKSSADTPLTCADGGDGGSAEPGLLADCDLLLSLRGELAGTGTLNWSGALPIASWDGVSVGGTPKRVTGLELVGKGLTGELPSGLAHLDRLTRLRVNGNHLSGRIPSALGDLLQLTHVHVSGNAFTGCYPHTWASVADSDLAGLGLPSCALVYDLHTPGSVAQPGGYAFLSDASDLQSRSALRTSDSEALLLHASDASGSSRAAFYETIRAGDTVDWWEGFGCFMRFRVTEVLPDPTGNPPRKLFAVEYVTDWLGRCDGHSEYGERRAMEFRWHPTPWLLGADGVRATLEPATGPGRYRMGLSLILVEVPAGMTVRSGAAYDAGEWFIEVHDVESGAVLFLREETAEEDSRWLPAVPPGGTAAGAPARDVNALFDRIAASAVVDR